MDAHGRNSAEPQLTKALALYNEATNSQISSLKDLQQRALFQLWNGKDVMCCLPTGYGKSLVYELLPFIDPGCLVIVVAPLDVIIEQQVNKCLPLLTK